MRTFLVILIKFKQMCTFIAATRFKTYLLKIDQCKAAECYLSL